MSSMLVLVGDADIGYAEFIGELLRRHTHKVVVATTRDSCRRFLDRSLPDLILVNSMAADTPLSDFVRELGQAAPDVPIITLAEDMGPVDVAMCLAAGADDCLQKPFHPAELLARIDTVTRRTRSGRTMAVDSDPPQIEDVSRHSLPPPPPEDPHSGHGQSLLTFDHARERVFYRGTDLACTELEFRILSTLVEMRGEVVSHGSLNERVWNYSNMTDGALVKPHISSIRRKLMKAGGDRRLIRTIYGVGYALSVERLLPQDVPHLGSVPVR